MCMAFSEETIEAAMEPLRTGVNYWTGTEGMKFEKDFARYNGSLCNFHLNGTSALTLH